MRDRLFLAVFLLGAGVLLFIGRDLLQGSIVLAWGIAFGGTTTVAVLGLMVYRFRIELKASRHEIARTEAELSLARKVQAELFPRHLPRSGGLEFAATCIPARGISGDYYDVLQLQDGRIIFVVADISGKGISAALLMANLQALLRALASIGTSPADVCSRLNYQLHQVIGDSRFATFFYAEWNRNERRLCYVNAGHNPPILFAAAGNRLLTRGGIPLGIFPDAVFEMDDVELRSGDLLVLYSDGITEAQSRRDSAEEFGEARLEAVVRAHREAPPPEISRRILEAVREWSHAEADDDMTLMIVRATESEITCQREQPAGGQP
jgi:sigma-B regulation protein RsbU (phosphoserine phosphatase)